MRKGYSQSPAPTKQGVSPVYGPEQSLSQNTPNVATQNHFMQQADRNYGQFVMKDASAESVGNMNGNRPNSGVNIVNNVNGPSNSNGQSNINGMTGVSNMSKDISIPTRASSAGGQMNMNAMAINGLNFDMNMGMGSDLVGNNASLNNVNIGMPGNIDGNMNFGGDADNSDLLFGTPLTMSF